MKKIVVNLQALVVLLSLCFFGVTVQAQSTIRNGNCPQLDEVYTTWETISTSYNAGGGWKVPKYAFSGGVTNGVATAEKYLSCSATISSSTNANKNRIRCIYSLEDDEPHRNISVFKDKPANYDCTCNRSNGRYQCVVK